MVVTKVILVVVGSGSVSSGGGSGSSRSSSNGGGQGSSSSGGSIRDDRVNSFPLTEPNPTNIPGLGEGFPGHRCQEAWLSK